MRLENWKENGNKMLIAFRLSENYVTLCIELFDRKSSYRSAKYVLPRYVYSFYCDTKLVLSQCKLHFSTVKTPFGIFEYTFKSP